MEVAHIDAWRRDPDRFWSFYGDRFASLVDKRPNEAHLALAELERRGLVAAVITQNIDRLHRVAGTRAADRGARLDRVERLPRLRRQGVARAGASSSCEAEDGAPECACLHHAAQARRRAVRRAAARAALAEAQALALEADLMVCVGSSLEVYPVAGLPALTHGGGGRLALITQGPTPYDDDAEVKLDGDVVEELARGAGGALRRRSAAQAGGGAARPPSPARPRASAVNRRPRQGLRQRGVGGVTRGALRCPASARGVGQLRDQRLQRDRAPAAPPRAGARRRGRRGRAARAPRPPARARAPPSSAAKRSSGASIERLTRRGPGARQLERLARSGPRPPPRRCRSRRAPRARGRPTARPRRDRRAAARCARRARLSTRSAAASSASQRLDRPRAARRARRRPPRREPNGSARTTVARAVGHRLGLHLAHVARAPLAPRAGACGAPCVPSTSTASAGPSARERTR